MCSEISRSNHTGVFPSSVSRANGSLSTCLEAANEEEIHENVFVLVLRKCTWKFQGGGICPLEISSQMFQRDTERERENANAKGARVSGEFQEKGYGNSLHHFALSLKLYLKSEQSLLRCSL